MKIDTKKLNLAKLNYFDKEENGTEVSDIQAYAFLVELNGDYVNFFNPFGDEKLQVFKRTIYPNVTRDGKEYGNRLKKVSSGDVFDGPCYIIENIDVTEMLGTDEISDEELGEYVCKSSKFFIDRIELLKKRKANSVRQRIFTNKKIEEDLQEMEKIDEYFDSHEKNKKIYKIG